MLLRDVDTCSDIFTYQALMTSNTPFLDSIKSSHVHCVNGSKLDCRAKEITPFPLSTNCQLATQHRDLNVVHLQGGSEHKKTFRRRNPSNTSPDARVSGTRRKRHDFSATESVPVTAVLSVIAYIFMHDTSKTS